jgi:hypothetical protein
MSTTWPETYPVPRIFKGRRGRTGPDRGVGLCRPSDPSSGQTDFRVVDRQEEKRTLPRAPAAVSAFRYVTVEDPDPGAGILTGSPFEGGARVRTFKRNCPISQGRLTHVQLLFTWNLSPLQSSKFSFEYLLLPPRSALEAVRPGVAPRASSRAPTPAYSPARRSYAGGGVWVVRLSAIHFQGWFIRQVSCYTLLSGFRLPWPPSCCLDEPTPFVVSDERTLRHLNPAFGSSRIASSAYQKWPTSIGAFECPRSAK